LSTYKLIIEDLNLFQYAGVFYCGAPTPIKELRELALEFSQKSKTKFDFHKENF